MALKVGLSRGLGCLLQVIWESKKYGAAAAAVAALALAAAEALNAVQRHLMQQGTLNAAGGT